MGASNLLCHFIFIITFTTYQTIQSLPQTHIPKDSLFCSICHICADCKESSERNFANLISSNDNVIAENNTKDLQMHSINLGKYPYHISENLKRRLILNNKGFVHPYPMLNEIGTIKSDKLFSKSELVPSLSIDGAVQVSASSLYFLTGVDSSSIKLLDMESGQEKLLYQGPSNITMSGLFMPKAGSAAGTLLSIEFEKETVNDSGHCTRPSIVFLRKSPSGIYKLSQRVPLEENTNDRTRADVFTQLPNGNVLFGVDGFTGVYELQPASSFSKRRSGFIVKKYSLPKNYIHFCAIQVGDEWRLVGTFDDRSVRLFEMADGLLFEVTRIFGLPYDIKPFEVFALSPGTLLIRSIKGCSTRTTFFHIVKYDKDGHFLMPNNVLVHEGQLYPLGKFTIPEESPSKVGFLAFDSTTKSLRFYEIELE